VQRDLAAVGLRVRLVERGPWSAYLERCTNGDYDLALLGWQADSLDPNDFLSALLASTNVGLTNRSRYRSAAMDALLRQGRRALDGAQRASIYREAARLFQADMPWVPLYHASTFTAYRKAVQGLSVGPTGLPRYDKVWKTE
jgi:cationic peptide transport system substrate-binding protein